MGCGYAVCAALALAGIALLFVAESHSKKRRTTDAWIAGSFGAILCIASVTLIAPMQRAVTRAEERRRREERNPHAPWTWDEAWTQRGGITQTGRRHAGPLMVFAVAAVVLSL